MGLGKKKKKGGSDFDVGVDTPINTMNLTITLTVTLICWYQCPRCYSQIKTYYLAIDQTFCTSDTESQFSKL